MDLATITRSIEEVATASKAAGAEVTKQIADILTHTSASDARILDLEQKILARGPGGAPNKGESATDFGAMISKSINYDELKSQRAWQRIAVPGSLRNIMKGVLVNTGSSGASPEFGYPTLGELLPGGPFGFTHRRLAILQALTSIPVSTAKVDFPKLVTNTDAAAVQVHEGDVKPETDLSFVMEVLEIATIASVLPVSRQVLADSPLLESFINTVMLFNTLKKYEDLVVSGNGTTDKISGLLTQGTIYLPTHAHASDMIGETISQLTALGFTANLIIMNADDHFRVISARNSLGSYVAGGGWSADTPMNLWGVPTVPTAAMPSGTTVILDTQVVRLLDREEANIQVGYSADDWIRNKVTLLAELRGQLAVQNQQGVAVVSIPVNSP